MHTDNVISFSGGKDSLAMLYLLRPIWHDATVMWVNTGAAHESTLAQMRAVKEMVPHFVEVQSNVIDFVERNGFPTDILPVWNSPDTHGMVGAQSEFCSALMCCRHNIWTPAWEAIHAMGAKVVYRGQKRCDEKQADLVDGQQVNGMTFRFPLADWSDEDVFNYLGETAPYYYAAGEESSRDCWLCTAYLDKNAARIQALPAPQKTVVVRKLADLKHELSRQQQLLDACLGEQ